MVSFEEAVVPVHDREFYRMLVEQGILPDWLDVEHMRLPGDPPPPSELETHELARLVRDGTEPAAWSRAVPSRACAPPGALRKPQDTRSAAGAPNLTTIWVPPELVAERAAARTSTMGSGRTT
jgi:hypothetical protein